MEAREMFQQEKALSARPEYGRNSTQESGGMNEAGATMSLLSGGPLTVCSGYFLIANRPPAQK